MNNLSDTVPLCARNIECRCRRYTKILYNKKQKIGVYAVANPFHSTTEKGAIINTCYVINCNICQSIVKLEGDRFELIAKITETKIYLDRNLKGDLKI